MPLLQREMEEIKDDWNQHRIRLQKKTDRPNGVPNDLYDFPDDDDDDDDDDNFIHVSIIK